MSTELARQEAVSLYFKADAEVAKLKAKIKRQEARIKADQDLIDSMERKLVEQAEEHKQALRQERQWRRMYETQAELVIGEAVVSSSNPISHHCPRCVFLGYNTDEQCALYFCPNNDGTLVAVHLGGMVAEAGEVLTGRASLSDLSKKPLALAYYLAKQKGLL
jgi:hypothetical protein